MCRFGSIRVCVCFKTVTYQGMNEILGPLYYVLASDSDIEWAAYAEADTFYCFQNVISEVKDHFIKHLDSSTVGIGECYNNVVVFDTIDC
jgi:hypothetical protein